MTPARFSTLGIVVTIGCTMIAYDAPAQHAASSTASTQEIQALIRQLGHADYARRESAQAALQAIGDAAIPHILPHADDPDREVAMRASALVRHPRAPAVRVQIAVHMLSTGSPKLLEDAIQILFDDADACLQPFRAAAFQPAASRYLRVAAPQIIDSMERWVIFNKTSRQLLERAQRQDPERVPVLQQNASDQRRDLALSAYYESIIEFDRLRGNAGPEPASTRPAPFP